MKVSPKNKPKAQQVGEVSTRRVSPLQQASDLADPVDYSPPGSSAHGVLQAGTLE